MLRGGAYKPRTSPYAFQGMGEEGVKILKEAGDAYGLPIVTEIVSAEHIPVMKDYVDVYQIGARNMQNFELLKKVGALGKPVILKRGLSATIEEWLMAAEYLLASGTEDVILCERGIRTYEKATRNTLDLSAIPIIRSLTHLPIIVDPSHAVGIRDKVPPMGLAAIAAGADGIIVEVHCNPDKALSDGAQSLYPEQFDKLMRDIDVLAPVVGKEVSKLRFTGSTAKDTVLVTPAKQQDTLSCAYCGSRGAYAENAVYHYFDNDVSTVSCASFREVFQMVQEGKVDYGMIPIENSLAGSVFENLDNLYRFEDVDIVGSLKLRIEHSLLTPKGGSLETIKNVYSHPQGFSQCEDFLQKYPHWNLIECSSTSDAAKLVSQKNSPENAAIASMVAAQGFNLEVLASGIETDPKNYTRFIVITTKDKENVYQISGEKIATVSFAAKNEPGALLACLSAFQKNNLNMTRLESRPIHGQPWHYMFYADIVLGETETALTEALNQLKQSAENTRLHGIYAELN